MAAGGISAERGRLEPVPPLGWAGVAVAAGSFIAVAVAFEPRLLALPAALAVLLVWWAPLAVVGATQLFVPVLPAPYVLVGLLALAVALPLLASGRARIPVGSVSVTAALFALWGLMSALWSVDVARTAEMSVALGVAMACGLCFAVLVSSADRLRLVLAAAAVLGAAVSLVALAQFALGTVPRPVGGHGDPNEFALDQLLLLPLVAALLSTTRRRVWRWALSGTLVLLVLAVLSTSSRGGAIALAVVLVLMLVVRVPGAAFDARRRLVIAAAVLVAGGGLLGVAGGPLFERFRGTEDDAGGSGRVNLWLGAETAIAREPLLGMGLGSFYTSSSDLVRETPGVDLGGRPPSAPQLRAHNAYLETAAELGVVGLLLLGAVLASTALALRRAARRAAAAGRPGIAAVASALVLSLTAFGVGSLFLSTQTSPNLWILVGLSLAVIGLTRPPAGAPRRARTPAPPLR